MTGFDAGLTREQIDSDYDARATITASAFSGIIATYRRLSDQAAASHMSRAALSYDPHSAEVMDLLGAGPNRPAVIMIHGGYWRALDRAHTRFMAPMLAARGIATLVPEYTLAPAASMSEITRQTRAALSYVWHNASDLGIDRRRIFAVGSSAGGHLAAALASPGWQVAQGLPEQPLAGVMPISGLFDLAPIARGHPQDWLHLTPQEVMQYSPLRQIPEIGCPAVVALAQTEATGFVRQSRAFADAWQSAGHPVRHMAIEQRNHFDVFLDFCDPDSALSVALLNLIGQS